MAAWTLRPNALELHLNPLEAARRHAVGAAIQLPSGDYYLYDSDVFAEDESMSGVDDSFGITKDYPIGRNIVENSNRLFVERNIYAHLNTSFHIAPKEMNAYEDEHSHVESITLNPPCFIIFGKPGVGRSSLAVALAKKLNSIIISPKSIVDYYLTNGLPRGVNLVKNDGSFSTQTLLSLVLCRLFELDVFHRGYILDGFPVIESKETSMKEQMTFLYSLPRRPDYVIILHMQDVDLYNRRRLQKYDPNTNTVYTMQQYMAAEHQAPTASLGDFELLKSISHTEQNAQDSSSNSGSENAMDTYDADSKPTKAMTELEFKPLDAITLGRLLSRVEDRPFYIKNDFGDFKKSLPYIQAFVDTFDSRKVLEVNAYELPSAIFKRVEEFLTNFGVTPVPMPIKLIPNRRQQNYDYLLGGEDDPDELGEEAPCIPYPEQKEEEYDWDIVERSCVIRGRVDSRFRWKMTAWQYFCPVALKYGRSIVGKPDLAVGFMSNIYFLSSEDALKEFDLNPRPFLLPTMPMSPTKFYVIGHPLAGKTFFSSELATYLGAYVIDMGREIRRRFHLVKHDHLFRVRLKAVFEITKEIDKHNFTEWKLLERSRREELLKYIEVMSSMDMSKERRMAMVENARAESTVHGIGDTYAGICQKDDGLLGFSYKEFKENWRKKRIWPHQKKLELAWKLFNEGKLKYRRDKKLERLIRKHKMYYEDQGEDGEGGESDEDVEEEELEESEEETSPPRQRRRRRFCEPKVKMNVEVDNNESVASSVFGPDDEPDESIALRYPNLDIPSEFINAHPKPSNVTEQDPLVTKLVAERLAEAEKWTDSLPPEIYVEILIRAISEVESKYLESNNHGPLSGGWIVDNLSPDLEKVKAILRHPVTAPDNIIVLTDNSDDKVQLLKNLNREYNATREELPYQSGVKIGSETQGEGDTCHQMEFSGEGYTRHWSEELCGEYGQAFRKFNHGIEYPHKANSELIHDFLPVDTLVEQLELEINNSLHSQEVQDKLRQISLRDSLLDISQREVLENWLATFGIYFPTLAGTDVLPIGDTPDQPPSTAVETTVCNPRPDCKNLFPIANYRENVWTPKKLTYEFLSLPKRQSLNSEKKHHVTKRGLNPSEDLSSEKIGEGDGGKDDLGSRVEFIGEHDEDLFPNRNTSLSLDADNIIVDSEGLEIYIPSIKAKFLHQIREFDEFWNMLIPILNKEKIKFWELGDIDEENVFGKVQDLWKSLESRFILRAKKLKLGELKIEYDEWMEANKIWKFAPDLIRKDEELGEYEESNDDFEGEGQEYDQELAKLAHMPEEYRKLLIGIERMRYFGDAKNVCVVTLKNFQLIRKGFPEFAAKYLDQTYYLSDEASRTEFLKEPTKFLPDNNGPLTVPCPRICVTGSPGCCQEEISLEMSKKYNIYYVNFRQRLHEILKVQIGENVGPGMLPSVKPAYTLLTKTPEIVTESNQQKTEGEEEQEEEDEETLKEEIEPKDLSNAVEFDGEDGDKKLSSKYDDLMLKKLGIMHPITMAHCPQTELQRIELQANRNWKKRTSIERAIKRFLEYGRQLSDEVLELILPMLWTEEPFKSKGFILTGFPNTKKDVKFLAERNLFPEYVFVVESQAKSMNSRLLRETVNEWFSQHPGQRKKMKETLRGRVKKVYIPFQQRKLTKEETEKLMNEYVPLEDSEDETIKSKDRLYKDTRISQIISQNLLHWHRIYSKHLRNLKISLNERRIEWMPIHTDTSLIESKRLLREMLTNCFIHRQSLFEMTYDLSLKEAETLLEKGFFHHSKFGRMCPVEVWKGNRVINLSQAPGITKYPILYRGYVYFLAGAENAKEFRLDPWNYFRQPPPTPTTPLYVIVLGKSKSGKTKVCNQLAEKLGLLYISAETMMNEIIQNSSRILEDDDMMPIAANGTTMLLAEEVLAYLRAGYQVPDYVSYRVLDFALMKPQSQFHGAVFDNYPLEDVQLQELLERGIVPAVVVNLQMEPTEGYRRAELSRFDPKYNYRDPLPDSNDLMDYMAENYEPLTRTCLEWYADEIQCLLNMDASQSPTLIFNQVKEKCTLTMGKIQHYIYSGLKGLPCRVDGLSSLTSLIPGKLSQAFGSYDPVALNDHEELVRVKDLTNMRRVVEYHGELYAFTTDKNVESFLANPLRYTFPHCKRVPPKDIPMPCVLTEAQMKSLQESWGFLTYDPVVYQQGNSNSKRLQCGNPQYTVEYRNRFYFFTTPETMERFMRKPQTFTNISVPTKLPGKFERKPLDSESLSPAGYLIASGLTNEVARMLDTVSKARPKFPFMSATKSSLLYLGYYLKTLNSKSSLDVRTHYRKAMAHMTRTQGNTRDLILEVNQLHGKQLIQEDVKRRLNLFLKLGDLPDNEKVLDPYIPGLNLNYEILFDNCSKSIRQNISCAPTHQDKAVVNPRKQAQGEEVFNVSHYNLPPYLNNNRLI